MFMKKVPHGRIDEDFNSLVIDMEMLKKSREQMEDIYDLDEWERKAEKEK